MNYFTGDPKDPDNWFDAIFHPKVAKWFSIVLVVVCFYELFATDQVAWLIAASGWGMSAISSYLIESYESLLAFILSGDDDDPV